MKRYEWADTSGALAPMPPEMAAVIERAQRRINQSLAEAMVDQYERITNINERTIRLANLEARRG